MKARFLTCLVIVGLVIGLTVLAPAPASAQSEETINGYLFSKLKAIASKSEESMYFIQKFNNAEVEIQKHAAQYQDDSALRALLGTKVTITGKMEGKVFSYKSVIKCPHATPGC